MQKTKEVTEEIEGCNPSCIHLLSHLIEGQRTLILGCKIFDLCLESAKIGFDTVCACADAEIPTYALSATASDITKRVESLIAEVAKLPFRDSAFDSAIITEALQNAIDRKSIIDETVRVVRNGGRIIILLKDSDPISSAEHAKSISKDLLASELMQYTSEVKWHDLPSKEWLICSLFIHKHNDKIKEKNKIDIIMPTFNGRRTIRKAINSLIYQTYQNWNLVVVNDGGEDIRDIIDEFGDSRIKYICSEHKGKPHALNLGITNSSAEFIGYLDDDDLLYPIHLEVLINAAMEQQSDLVYDDWYEVCIDEFGQEIKRYFEHRNDVSPSMLILRNYINHKCILHSRALLNEVGLYDEELEILIDWDMIRRLSFARRPHHISSVTSEHINYYKQNNIENKITGMWVRDPERAKRSLKKIINKTSELPATEGQLKESITEALSSFSYFHQFEMNSILQQVKSRAEMAEREVAEMQRSIVWQLVNKFHNVFINRACPQYTRRRIFYDLFLKSCRIIFNEGWDSFWFKFKEYQRSRKILSGGIHFSSRDGGKRGC